MSRLIDVDELKADYGMANDCKDCKQVIRACQYDTIYSKMDFCGWLDDAPTVDAVPRGAYDQVRWERDIAVGQLEQLGYALGEKVTPIVRCKDCKNSEHWYRDKRRCFLWVEDGIDVFNDGFCNYGEKDGDHHEEI